MFLWGVVINKVLSLNAEERKLEKPLDEAEGNGEITEQIANQALASKVIIGFIVVWTHDERSLTDYPV